MHSKDNKILEWALSYPIDLSAKAVLVVLATAANGKNVTVSTQELSEILAAPKRTCEDALRRLAKAGAIKGKRGVYRLRVPRYKTTVHRENKLKKQTNKRIEASVDNAPVWWSILTSLSIDARRGHVGLKPDDLPRIKKWVKDNGLTDFEVEDAADKIAARWPIKNQKVVYSIFYTYCRYQLKDREQQNGKGRIRNIGKRVHLRRVTRSDGSDPFANFQQAEDS